MSASMQNIKSWFDEALKNKCTHLIIVTDTYDYSNHPVYVNEVEDVRKIADQITNERNMEKVEEVYLMSMGWKSQSRSQRKVRNFEANPRDPEAVLLLKDQKHPGYRISWGAKDDYKVRALAALYIMGEQQEIDCLITPARIRFKDGTELTLEPILFTEPEAVHEAMESLIKFHKEEQEKRTPA